jgi:hypothetical protein
MIKLKSKIMKYDELTQAEKDSVKIVDKVINEKWRVSDRAIELRKLGFGVGFKSMGNGGRGQLKRYHNKVIMQIGYGKGEYNYAYYVYLTL